MNFGTEVVGMYNKKDIELEPELKPGVTPDRPTHGPRQVREISEIHVGDSIVCHNKIGLTPITVTGEPFQDSNGEWYVKAEYTENGLDATFHAADLGAVPYSNGMWHKNNWLEKVDLMADKKL